MIRDICKLNVIDGTGGSDGPSKRRRIEEPNPVRNLEQAPDPLLPAFPVQANESVKNFTIRVYQALRDEVGLELEDAGQVRLVPADKDRLALRTLLRDVAEGPLYVDFKPPLDDRINYFRLGALGPGVREDDDDPPPAEIQDIEEGVSLFSTLAHYAPNQQYRDEANLGCSVLLDSLETYAARLPPQPRQQRGGSNQRQCAIKQLAALIKSSVSGQSDVAQLEELPDRIFAEVSKLQAQSISRA